MPANSSATGRAGSRKTKNTRFFVCFWTVVGKTFCDSARIPQRGNVEKLLLRFGQFWHFFRHSKKQGIFLWGQNAEISVLFIKKTHVKIQPWQPVKVHHRVSTPSFHIRSGGKQVTTKCSRIWGKYHEFQWKFMNFHIFLEFSWNDNIIHYFSLNYSITQLHPPFNISP